MSKKQVIKAKYLPARLPLLGTAVAWLMYRELDLTGVGAGVYITIVSIILGFAWIFGIVQIFIVDPSEPVFKEHSDEV